MKGIFRNGERILRDPQGALVSVKPELADRLLSEGVNGNPFREVSEQDVVKADFEQANSGIGAKLETYRRNAQDAATDVVSLGGRLLAKPFVEGVNAVSHTLGGPNAPQGDPEAAQRAWAAGLPAMVAGVVHGGSADERIAAAQAYVDRTRQLSAVDGNQLAAGAGQLSGQLGVALATGGVTSAAAKGTTAALARAGAGRAAGVLGTGLATGVEGATYGAGMAEGQARAAGQDAGATAEQLVQGMGYGFLIGAGVGAGTHALGSSFRKVLRTVDDKAAELVERMKRPPSAAEAADDRLAEMWAKSTGADKQFLEEIGPQNMSAEASRKRSLIQNAANTVDEAVPVMTSTVSKLEQANAKLREVVDRFVPRAEGIRNMLLQDKVPLANARAQGIEAMRASLEVAQNVVDALPKGIDDTKQIFRRIRNHVSGYKEELATVIRDGGDAAEVNATANQMKREMQGLQKLLKGHYQGLKSKNPAAAEELKAIWTTVERDVQEPLRASLEDASVWGRAGKAQEAINRPYKRSIDSSKRYEEELLRGGVEPWGIDERAISYADSAKVKSFINKIGTPEGTTAVAKVREHMADLREFQQAIGEYHPLSGLQQQIFNEVNVQYANLEQHIAKLDETMQLVGKFRAVEEAEKRASALPDSMLTRTIQTVAGAVQAGPMGGVLGASGVLMRPASAIKAATQIHDLAARIGMRTEQGAINVVTRTATKIAEGAAQAVRTGTRAVGGAASVASRVKTPTALQLFMGKDSNPQEAYARHANTLQQMVDEPSLIAERASQRLGGLSDVNPEVAGAVLAHLTNATSYLHSKLPSGALDPTPLSPARKAIVSPVEIKRFARIFQAVERPLSVVEDLAKGRATRDQIDALRAVHPETFAQVRRAVYGALIDAAQKGQRVPLATRQQLDSLFDLAGAGEPAFGPAVTDRILDARAAKIAKGKVSGAPRTGGASRPPKASAKVPGSFSLPQDSWMK